MAFKVKVLLDSISPLGVRLTTFKTHFPREILAEVNTHTILSKSASSSRAIPGQRLRDVIRDNLYVPEFGSNQKGMQAGPPLDGPQLLAAQTIWKNAAFEMCNDAESLEILNVHKQVINRLVENFGWTNQVITGTEWANFFALRTHPDAHPAFRTLARAMYIAYSHSTPKQLDYYEYHLPFVGQGKLPDLSEILMEDNFPHGYISTAKPIGYIDCMTALYRSVACCARVSYETLDGTPKNVFKDFELHQKLSKTQPKHVSPFQHQASPMSGEFPPDPLKSNLRGWVQYRKTIPGENITEFSPTPEEVTAWNIPEDIFTE